MSSTSDEREPTGHADDGRTRIGRLLALGTAVMLIVAAAVIVGGVGSLDPEPVATNVDDRTATEDPDHATTVDPVAVAERYIAARDTWDAEQARELAADDVTATSFVTTAGPAPQDSAYAPDDFERIAAFERATGWRFLEPDCTVTERAPAHVRCDYITENAWSRALEVGPLDGSRFEFVIADGKITEIADFFDITTFSSRVWEVFGAWVRNAHPDDAEVMYPVAAATPEAIALWEQHTATFVAIVDGAVDIAERFISARDEWDGSEVRSLLHDDAAINDVVTKPDAYVVNAEFERATGRRFRRPDCAVTEAGPPTKVACSYVLENAWSQALDAGPFFGSELEMSVTDDMIERVVHTMALSAFEREVWEPVTDWLQANHPQDVDEMLDDDGPLQIDRTTPAALALWDKHTDDFTASFTSADDE